MVWMQSLFSGRVYFQRWTRKARERIMKSRVLGTRLLVKAIEQNEVAVI